MFVQVAQKPVSNSGANNHRHSSGRSARNSWTAANAGFTSAQRSNSDSAQLLRSSGPSSGRERMRHLPGQRSPQRGVFAEQFVQDARPGSGRTGHDDRCRHRLVGDGRFAVERRRRPAAGSAGDAARRCGSSTGRGCAGAPRSPARPPAGETVPPTKAARSRRDRWLAWRFRSARRPAARSGTAAPPTFGPMARSGVPDRVAVPSRWSRRRSLALPGARGPAAIVARGRLRSLHSNEGGPMRSGIGMCPATLLANFGDPSATTSARRWTPPGKPGRRGFPSGRLTCRSLGGAEPAAAIVKAAGLRMEAVEAAVVWSTGKPRGGPSRGAHASPDWSPPWGPPGCSRSAWSRALDDLDRAREGLAVLGDHVSAAGAQTCVEFLPWTGIPDLATAWSIVEPVGSGAGIVLDTWHWQRQPRRPESRPARSDPGRAHRLRADVRRRARRGARDGGGHDAGGCCRVTASSTTELFSRPLSPDRR